MKKIFLLLLILGVFCNLFATDFKEKMANTPAANLPFECTKVAPWGKPGYKMPGSELGNLPLYTYTDFGLTQNTDG